MPYCHRMHGGFDLLSVTHPGPEFVSLYQELCGQYPNQMWQLLPSVSGLFRFQNVMTGIEIAVADLAECWEICPYYTYKETAPPVTINDDLSLYYSNTAAGAQNAIMSASGTDLSAATGVLIGTTLIPIDYFTNGSGTNDWAVFTVPSDLPPGDYTITLVLPDGNQQLGAPLSIMPPAAFVSLTPTQIPVDGGLQLTLSTVGFMSDPGGWFVDQSTGTQYNIDDASRQFDSQDQISVFCSPPNVPLGVSLDYACINPNGGADLVIPNAVTVVADQTYPWPQSVTTLSVVPGQQISVNGTNMSKATNVYFIWRPDGSLNEIADGSMYASITPVDDSHFLVTVPSGIPAANVATSSIMLTVQSQSLQPNVTTYLQGHYFQVGPAITQLTPYTCPVDGGRVLQLLGIQCFKPTYPRRPIEIIFQTSDLSNQWYVDQGTMYIVNDSDLIFCSPPLPGALLGGYIDVNVTGDFSQLLTSVAYVNTDDPKAPVPTSTTPVSGPVGTVVTINGTNLTGVNSCTFAWVDANGTGQQASVAAGNVVVINDTTLHVTVPSAIVVTQNTMMSIYIGNSTVGPVYIQDWSFTVTP